MRRAVHGVRFHPVRGATGPDGKWGPGNDPDAPRIKANVTSPRVGEVDEAARPITCAAFISHRVYVDPTKLVEIVDHPLHTGLFHIEGVSGGGRWTTRISLRRYVRTDSTHAAR